VNGFDAGDRAVEPLGGVATRAAATGRPIGTMGISTFFDGSLTPYSRHFFS
jgi:hypothetical protein